MKVSRTRFYQQVALCLCLGFLSNLAFSSSLRKESVLSTLDLIESTLTDPVDNYFIEMGISTVESLREDFDRIKIDYKSLFPAKRNFDLSNGVVVLDLDNNVWKEALGKDRYVTAGMPLKKISKVIATALEHKMVILILSSGIHMPFAVETYFHRVLGVSHINFSRSFDIIVGSKTLFSSFRVEDELFLKRQLTPPWCPEFRAQIDAKIKEVVLNRGQKGKLFSAWLRSHINPGQSIGDIYVMDDDKANVLSVHDHLKRSNFSFDMSDFCGVHTAPSFEYPSLENLWEAVDHIMWERYRYKKLQQMAKERAKEEAKRQSEERAKEEAKRQSEERAKEFVERVMARYFSAAVEAAKKIVKVSAPAPAKKEVENKIAQVSYYCPKATARTPHYRKPTFSFLSQTEPSTRASKYKDWVESLRTGKSLKKEAVAAGIPWSNDYRGCSVCD